MYDIPYIHNDWLQLAIETGWVGALLIFLLFAFLFIECLIRWWKTEDPWGFGFGLAALGTMVAITIHELVDFSLRIPCNPLFLVIVMCPGQSWARSSEPKSQNRIGRCQVFAGCRLRLFFGCGRHHVPVLSDGEVWPG